MKQFVVIVLLLMTFQSFSQTALNYGFIIADTNFCRNSNMYDTISICNSKNELDIRLAIHTFKQKSFDFALIELVNNGCTWKATKYTYTLVGGEECTYSLPQFQLEKVINLKPKINFDTFFEALKDYNVFNLPNQLELINDTTCNWGNVYTISFKAGNTFRAYGFCSPEDFRKKYKEKTEFVNYEHIASLFLNDLTPE